MPRPAAPSFEGIGPWPSKSTVALACSGGADSTYLALKWREYAQSLGEQAPSAVVWVVDHAHRPGTAAEAEQAAAIYRDLGFSVRLLHPETLASERGMDSLPGRPTSENQLRQIRYRLFAAQAKIDDASILLTAHHADDQAETVLLRILRGTGLHGLAGMPAVRTLGDFGVPNLELRRPLLACRASQIRLELAQDGQTWIEDPTNELAEAAARNLLRMQIMPLLGEISPGDPVEAVLQLASDAQQWRSWLDSGFDQAGSDDWSSNWVALPSVLRLQAIRRLTVAAGVRSTRQSLSDWESALIRRGSTSVNETHRLSIAGGRLCLLERKDPTNRQA